MNPEHHDKTFVATFLAVLGFLGAFTVLIIIIANRLSAADAPDEAATARIAERIRPVGQVVTDPSRLLAMAPVAAAARAPMTGAEVVARACAACHDSGVLNAPKVGDKAVWNKLKAAGLGTMVSNAIKGKGQMPARGGDPSLSDDEVKAAVEHMLKQAGV